MIVKATPNEPANDIIKRAGIETSESLTQIWWEYNGERILRPLVNRWEEVVFEKWGIKIEYVNDRCADACDWPNCTLPGCVVKGEPR